MVVAEAAQRLRLPLISKNGEIHEEDIEKWSTLSRSSFDSTSTSITLSSSATAVGAVATASSASTTSTTDATEADVGGVPNRFLGITPAYLWKIQLHQMSSVV